MLCRSGNAEFHVSCFTIGSIIGLYLLFSTEKQGSVNAMEIRHEHLRATVHFNTDLKRHG